MVKNSMRILAILLLMGAGMAVAAQAEIGNSITVNPLGFVGWGPDIEYEAVVGPASALALRAKVGGWSINEWSNTALGGGVGWRFFLDEDQKAPRGLWVGPTFDVLNVTSKYQDEEPVSALFYAIYGQLGYKWIFGKKVGFVLSPFINLGYSMGEITNSVGDTLSLNGLYFGVGLAIGVAF
jgi:hypothetical protein